MLNKWSIRLNWTDIRSCLDGMIGEKQVAIELHQYFHSNT